MQQKDMITHNVAGSAASIEEATKYRASFSGHGKSLGAAGYIDPHDQSGNVDFLGKRGDTLSISPPAEGFGDILIGAAWDHRVEKDTSFLGKLLRHKKSADIDLDLGILYELHDGRRGVVQAFGEMMGAYERAPYISLSGDERTGKTPGEDEFMHLNGAHWPDIKRVLVYIYIYKGALDWGSVTPQVHIRIPGSKPMVVTLSSHQKGLGLCAIAGIENVRNGLRVTNYTEYFPGHAEMDRAFGFGIEWEEGSKE